MTVPATSIALQDDGTAWWYTADPIAHSEGWALTIDRPCDSECFKGTATYENYIVLGSPRCPDCIDGRHTFTIDVEPPFPETYLNDPTRSLRVSVVPGMIAQIVGIGEATTETQYPFITPKVGGGWVLHHIPRAMAERTPITLPSDAKPGGWAVQLVTERAVRGDR